MLISYDLSFEFEYKGMTAQLRKIKEEVSELEEAILDKKYLRVTDNTKIATEAFDVIEACFTLLKFECWFYEIDMETAYNNHKNKLQSREMKKHEIR